MSPDNQKRPSVIVLTTRLPEDLWLINKIADVAQVVGVVLPIGKRYREYGVAYVLKKRIRKLGILAVADQALLVLYRLLFECRRDAQVARALFADEPTDSIQKSDADVLEVKDINSERVRDFILTKSPRLVVVSGAPLLKEILLDAAPGRMVNLHPGYAPRYRGRYGSFWPIFNGEPEMVGTTIHFVDKGVDTGRILLQQRVRFEPDDTLRAITYRQHKLGGQLLVRCLKNFERLAAKAVRKENCVSNNYLAPGLTHYIRGRRWLRRNSQAAQHFPAS